MSQLCEYEKVTSRLSARLFAMCMCVYECVFVKNHLFNGANELG